MACKESSIYEVLKDPNMYAARYVNFPMWHWPKEKGSACNNDYFGPGTWTSIVEDVSSYLIPPVTEGCLSLLQCLS